MKRVISIFFVIIIILMTMIPVFAEETTTSEPEMIEKVVTLSETTVHEDFENLSGVEGNTISESDYPAVPGKEPSILTIVEDCKLPNAYSLYVYIYNPGHMPMLDAKIQLKFKDDSNFFDYSATYINDNGNVWKYRIVMNNMANILSKESRTIIVAGIKIIHAKLVKGDKAENSKDGFVNNQFYSYGFGKTYGYNQAKASTIAEFTFTGNNPSVLTSATGADGLKMDVDITYYRTSSDTLNVNHQTMTMSFIVPNSYFDAFNDISRIEYEYERYSNVPIYVSNFDVSKITQPYAFVYDLAHSNYGGSVNRALKIAMFTPNSVNDLQEKCSDISIFCGYKFYSIDEYQQYSFDKADNDNPFIFVNDNDDIYLSSEQLYKILDSADYKDILGEVYYDHPNRSIKNKLVVDSFVTEANFFEKLAYIYNNGIGSIVDDQINSNTFAFVDPNDVTMSDFAFSTKYLIEEKEVHLIKQRINTAEQIDGKLCLYRFDVTEFSSCEAALYGWQKYKNHPIMGNSWTYRLLGNIGGFLGTSPEKVDFESNSDKVNEFCFTYNTVYDKVDVLSLTFEKDKSEYIVPVIADPIRWYVAPTVPSEELKPDIIPGIPGFSNSPIIKYIISRDSSNSPDWVQILKLIAGLAAICLVSYTAAKIVIVIKKSKRRKR